MKALVLPLDLSCSGCLAGRGLLCEMLLGELCHSVCFLQVGQASSLKYEEADNNSLLGAVFCLLWLMYYSGCTGI